MVVTFVMVYILKLVIDMCAYTLVNVADVTGVFLGGIKRTISIFAPVIIACVSFYVLLPLVELLKKYVANRQLACTFVFAMLALPLVLALSFGWCKLNNMGGGSLSNGVSLWLKDCTKQIDRAYMELKELLKRAGVEKYVMPYIERLLNRKTLSVGEISSVLCHSVLNFFLGMVMAFYLLAKEKPFENVKKFSELVLPKKLYKALSIVAEDFDAVFSGYIRGQLVDGAFMTVLISIALWLLKIPWALPIGIVSGFSNIIPYFGSAVGFVLTAFSAILSGKYSAVLYGCGAMLLLQQVDSAFIVPKVVGKKVDISPFWVIAALSVGGRLFGIWGMVLAVPLTGSAKVVLLRICKRREKSLKIGRIE